jgi:hypothetical protein
MIKIMFPQCLLTIDNEELQTDPEKCSEMFQDYPQEWKANGLALPSGDLGLALYIIQEEGQGKIVSRVSDIPDEFDSYSMS